MLRDPTLASEYAALEAQMDALRMPGPLRAAVEDTLRQVPEGAIALFSTSDSGAGVAAACAAKRDEPTVWRRINLAVPPEAPDGYAVVIVEPVEPGPTWRRVIESRFPGAEVVVVGDRSQPQAPVLPRSH